MKRVTLTCVIVAAFAAGGPAVSQDLLERRVRDTVRERGEVEAALSTAIRSPVASTIVYVVEEGIHVQEGDLILKLDSSAIDELRDVQVLEYERSRAELIQAKTALETHRAEFELQRELLQHQLELALASRDAYLGDGGEHELLTEAAKLEIEILRRELELAQARFEATNDPDQHLAAMRSRGALAIAERKLAYLEERLRPLKQMQFDAQIVEGRLQMGRVEAQAGRHRLELEASIVAAETAVQQAESRLQRLDDQLSRCQITAPQAGIVDYVRSSRDRAGTTVEEGAQVRERQALLNLADPSQMQIRTLVHESSIGRVQPGQPARIRIDALPDRWLAGRVESIAQTPEPTSWLNPDVRMYAVVVGLPDQPDGLRPGLTALVEIQTGRDER